MDGGKVIIKIDGDTKPFENSMKSVDEGIGTLNKAFAAIGAAGADGLAAATKYGMDFEAQMSTVEAISGATAEQMGQLTDKAKEMGVQSVFSATEAGQAFEYMAMAGWKSEDMLNGIEGIMNLAAASGEDLAMVSDIVTDSMTAFGLAAEESGRFADVLAAASSNSNTNVALLGESFKYVAPVAGSLNYTIEDTAVALGLMANAGIKASQSGTALRSLFTRLVKPTKQSGQAMDDLGISITDTKGNLKPLNQLLQDLRGKFSKLTDAQKAEYAALLAGQEGMSGLLAIVNASDDDFNKLTEAINNSAGSAKEMSEIRLDNLQGQITLLGSSFEGLGIAVYDKFGNMLKEAVKVAIEWLNEFTEKLSNGELDKILEIIAAGITGIGTALLSLNVVFIIQDVINAFKGLEATTKLVAAAQTVLNAVMAVNPYVLVATAVVAATAALAVYISMQETGSEKAKELIDESEVLNEKINEQAEAYETLRDSQHQKTIGDLAAIQNAQNLYSELEKLVDANGEVQDSDKARVQFILNELNSALGTELKLVDNQIQGYKDLKQSIEESIKAKQLEIIMADELKAYENAIKNIKSATDDETEASLKLAEAQAEINRIEAIKQLDDDLRNGQVSLSEYSKRMKELGGSILDIDGAMANAQEAYKTADEALKTASATKEKYLQDISRYEEDYAKVQNGVSDEVVAAYMRQGTAAEETAKKVAEGEATKQQAAGETYARAIVELDNFMKSHAGILTGAEEEELKSLQTTAINAKTEAENVGVNVVNGMIKGLDDNSYYIGPAIARVANLISDTAKEELDINSPSGVMRDEVGAMVAAGVAEGISGDYGTSLVQKAITTLASHIPQWAKDILGIHSPSAVMRDEVGAMIIAGLVEGITDNRSEVQKVMDDTIEELLDSEKLFRAEQQRLEDEAAAKALQAKYDNAEKELKLAKEKAAEQLAEDLKNAGVQAQQTQANADKELKKAKDNAAKQLEEDLKKADTQEKIEKAHAKNMESIQKAEEKYAEQAAKKATAGQNSVTKAYEKNAKAISDAEKKYAETIEQIEQDEINKAEEKAQKEYLDNLQKAAEQERKLLEAREKDIKAAKEKIIDAYADMADRITNAIKEVEDTQKSLADKFKNFGDLYYKVDDVDIKFSSLSDITEQYADWKKYSEKLAKLKERDIIPEDFYNTFKGLSVEEGIKRADEMLKKSDNVLAMYIDKWRGIKDYEKGVEDTFTEAAPKFELSDLDAQTKQLQEYTDALQELKERGLSEGLFAKIRDMSVEEGTNFMSALLAASDEEFNDYVTAWENKQIKTGNMAKDLYSGEVQKLEKTVLSELDDFSAMLSTEAAKSGEDWITSFVEEIGKTAPQLFEDLNAALSGLVSSPSPTDAGGIVNNYTTYTERAPVTVEAKLEIGGREFAQAALPPLREELKRTGQSL